MSEFIVPAIAPRIRLLASGPEEARRVFSFPFPAANAGDIAVHRDGTLLESGYATVFAEDRQGGTITFDTAVPAGVEIVILRSTVIERATDFVENGAFRASALNLELDRLTMIAQELDLAGRAGLHRDPTEIGPDLVLPAPPARANGLLGFSADGQALAVLPVESLRGEKGETGPQGPAGDMSGTNNLAELTDPAAARANLDVAGWGELNAGLAEVDAAIRQVDLNLALNTLRDAIDAGWTTLAMVDGFADEFNDQSGVDINPAENAPLWGATNGYGTLSGDKITFTGSGSYWGAALGELALSTGKRYAEVEYSTVYAGAARYQSHGVTSVTIPGNNVILTPGTYHLLHHGELVDNGVSQGDKRDTAMTSQFGSWVPPGTKGCIAIDFDAGRGWLGFVTPWGLPWWVNNGRPEDGVNPSFTFPANTPMRLMAYNYQNVMKINTGRAAFANQMVPRGFIPGWFETDGVVDGPFGPNIAPTGTANSLYGQSGIRTCASVNDQDLNSFWQAASLGTNSTIYIQFPESRTVKRAILRRHAGGTTYLTGINLEGSNDGTSWTVLAQYVGGPRAEGDYIFDVAAPQPFTHYQLRAIYSSANGMAVAEFQLYEAVPVVNTTAGLSTGQAYDAAGNYYAPLKTQALIGDCTTSANLSFVDAAGAAVPTGSYDGGSASLSALVDNSASTFCMWAYGGHGAASNGLNFRVDLGEGNAKSIGAFSITPKLYSSDGGNSIPPGWKLQWSDDGSAWTDSGASVSGANGNNVTYGSPVVAVSAHRYWRILCTQNASNVMVFGTREVEFLEYDFVTHAMTLASAAAAADEEPVAARAVLLVEPLEAITLGTDLICGVSRDDGESWTALALSREVAFESGLELLAGAEASLELQPSGTAMRIRLLAPTSRRIRVKGWALQWR